jgi:GxxExxY protein
MNEGNLLHGELTRSIIGAAMAVSNTLKPGLDEKINERALTIELTCRGHTVQSQRQFPVDYRGQHIGTLVPDMIVDERVVVDPKVVSAFNETHLAQMVGYLSITQLDLALLINFKYAAIPWKRVVQTADRASTDGD